jgi:hypothetical protein
MKVCGALCTHPGQVEIIHAARLDGDSRRDCARTMPLGAQRLTDIVRQTVLSRRLITLRTTIAAVVIIAPMMLIDAMRE